MKGVSETLAGRIGILHLLGLSNMEIEGKGMESASFRVEAAFINERMNRLKPKNLQEIYDQIWRGS
jgi:hypothetical protein